MTSEEDRFAASPEGKWERSKNTLSLDLHIRENTKDDNSESTYNLHSTYVNKNKKTNNNSTDTSFLQNMQILPSNYFTIRNKKAVYYEMYKKAKQKARAARDLATTAYLETMRIKNLYMLDSDDENLSDEEVKSLFPFKN